MLKNSNGLCHELKFACEFTEHELNQEMENYRNSIYTMLNLKSRMIQSYLTILLRFQSLDELEKQGNLNAVDTKWYSKFEEKIKSIKETMKTIETMAEAIRQTENPTSISRMSHVTEPPINEPAPVSNEVKMNPTLPPEKVKNVTETVSSSSNNQQYNEPNPASTLPSSSNQPSIKGKTSAFPDRPEFKPTLF